MDIEPTTKLEDLNALNALNGLASGADRLRAMHRRGEPLVLVNAWDVASAQRVVAAGGRAIATSSAAVAASLGLPDDPTAPVDTMLEAVGRIAAAVDVPVTADLLDGYGLGSDELVERLLGAGAVGCNIEDSDHASPGRLIDPDQAAGRIAALRAAATSAGVEVVINARIDTYLYNPDATADVVERGRRYIEAGADCVYPIRLTDPVVARQIVEQLDAPVNANLGGNLAAADIADLAAAGVSRISIGPMAFRSALATIDQIAAGLFG
jgi:2-methylisocitrate lyase-like PEP mutase family enzyme